MTEPRIEVISNKILLGRVLRMSFDMNKTAELWGAFMPRRKEIAHIVDTNLYSLQVYGKDFFEKVDPSKEFDKWALVEVSEIGTVPEGMSPFYLPGGLYAVFRHKGAGTTAENAFRHILFSWLPASEYLLDDRPHFEILGEKYRNGDPNSEEEIWIPIKHRTPTP